MLFLALRGKYDCRSYSWSKYWLSYALRRHWNRRSFCEQQQWRFSRFLSSSIHTCSATRHHSTINRMNQLDNPSISSDKQQTLGTINQYIDNQKQMIELFRFMINHESIQVHDTKLTKELQQMSRERTPPDIVNDMTAGTATVDSTTIHTTGPILLHDALTQSTIYKELALSLLRRGYYNAMCHPWVIGWTMIYGGNDSSDKSKSKDNNKDETIQESDDYYVVRYHGTHRYHVVQDRKKHNDPFVPGEMILYEHHTDNRTRIPIPEYHRDIRTHFCNSPSFIQDTKDREQYGNVHIALGFNDLQVLLHYNHNNGEDETNGSNKNNDPPMFYVGYDRSTYSIAKTLVILQLLKDQNVQPHPIVEAWYSSTWSYETLMMFRYACISILDQKKYIINLGPTSPSSSFIDVDGLIDEIRQYIHHWAYDAVPITASDAIQRWFLESIDNGHVYTQSCNFRRSSDRIALLQYFSTGQFSLSTICNGQTPLKPSTAPTEMVGSLAMWNVPSWAPKSNKTDQDRVNNTVSFQSILNEITNDTNDDRMNFVEAMYNIKVRQIKGLQTSVQTERIQIDIRYGDIRLYDHRIPETVHLAKEIRQLKPTSISWSNLMDYMSMYQFHKLAHSYSSIDTTHYGYTMNWTTMCYGTYITDYDTKAERAQILSDTIESAKQDALSSEMGEYITIPTYEHTYDQAGDLLGKRYRPSFVEHFIHEAKKGLVASSSSSSITTTTSTSGEYKNSDANWKSVFSELTDEMQLPSPILRSNRSIYFTWKYRSMKAN